MAMYSLVTDQILPSKRGTYWWRCHVCVFGLWWMGEVVCLWTDSDIAMYGVYMMLKGQEGLSHHITKINIFMKSQALMCISFLFCFVGNQKLLYVRFYDFTLEYFALLTQVLWALWTLSNATISKHWVPVNNLVIWLSKYFILQLDNWWLVTLIHE